MLVLIYYSRASADDADIFENMPSRVWSCDEVHGYNEAFSSESGLLRLDLIITVVR